MQCEVCNGTGERAGARECFVPRPGKVFFQNDYPQLELYTLAQCCMSWLGQSSLAKALNEGLDPHLQLACVMLGIEYGEGKKALKDETHPLHKTVKEARGAAKVANFGFPGGLGVKSFVSYAKTAYDVIIVEDEPDPKKKPGAKQLKEFWTKAWPEMPFYFARVNAQGDGQTGRGECETLWTQRKRGQATYCARCNNGFQALGSDCAKRATWLITRAMYAEPASPLFNDRLVAFIHDEFIGETDDDAGAHDAAYELARLMVVGANEYLPDVQIPMSKQEPLLMRRWSKKAAPTFGADGRLVPWG